MFKKRDPLLMGKNNPAKRPEVREKLRKNALKQFENGMPLETRKKLSKAHKGKKMSKETKEKHRENARTNPNYGMKNKKHTENTKQIIRDKKKGQKHSEATKGKISKNLKGVNTWMKGKKLSKETREKMGKSRTGDKHPNWQGGITTLTTEIRRCQRYKDWCRQIFERDKFTCQDCGQYAENLNAHHIFTFSEIIKKFKIDSLLKALNCSILWDLSNGITLCIKCHKKRHKKGG